MRESIIACAIGAALTFSAGLAQAAPATTTTTRSKAPVALRLIGLNDFHGNLAADPRLTLPLADPAASDTPVRTPVGGAAALAGLVQTLRAGAPHSLMLSSGDLIGAAPLASTLFRHESTIAVMNALGLDIATLGNHEFDGGLAEIQRIARGGCAVNVPGSPVSSCSLGPAGGAVSGEYAGARFPVISSNVLGSNGKPVFAPYVVKRFGGIPVGFIGAVTHTVPSLVIPSGVAGLRFDDEVTAINRAARQLRARGVKAMVLTIHEGGEIGDGGGPEKQHVDWNDSTCPRARGPIFDIAKRLSPDIGVVFSAHSHQGYRCLMGGRTIIQATYYGRGLAVVDVALSRRTQRFIAARTHSINLPVFNERTDPAVRERLAAATPAPFDAVLRDTRPDPVIAQMVAADVAAVAPVAERTVGRITARFGRFADTDSEAGRLIADSQLAATQAPTQGGAQIAFMNSEGIRTELECPGQPPCPVSFGQVFTMQPFGNTLVLMTLTGAQIKAVLESQLSPDMLKQTLLQPSAGFGYTWVKTAPAGERVRDMRLNGEPLQPQQSYRIVVNNFLAEGGDGFVLFKQGTDRQTGPQDLDSLLDYLKANDPVAPVAAPRVTTAP